MTRIEKLLFQLTIFLIPTNLFLKWITTEAYINGILVDYLLPKLYLSDIPILILLLLWFVKSWKKWSKEKIKFSFKNLIPTFFFYSIFVFGLLSQKPMASTWFWLKLLELTLFYYWIKSHKVQSKHIYKPLVFSALFQSSIGLYQFISQQSLFGFWFFGETTLTHSSNILKSSFFGRQMILPYGTTPHPNILGGFLAVSLFILITHWKKIHMSKFVQISTLILASITLILTNSISAILALIISLILISKKKWLLLPIIALTMIFYQPITNSDSFTRRSQLSQFSLQMIKDHFFTGVGLNNFTDRLPEYGTIQANTSFLQPTHNIYLLWFAETGLIGAILLLSLLKKPSFKTIYFSPIIIMLTIGLFDHYPLTLQTGQLTSLLAIILHKHDS